MIVQSEGLSHNLRAGAVLRDCMLGVPQVLIADPPRADRAGTVLDPDAFDATDGFWQVILRRGRLLLDVQRGGHIGDNLENQAGRADPSYNTSRHRVVATCERTLAGPRSGFFSAWICFYLWRKGLWPAWSPVVVLSGWDSRPPAPPPTQKLAHQRHQFFLKVHFIKVVLWTLFSAKHYTGSCSLLDNPPSTFRIVPVIKAAS